MLTISKKITIFLVGTLSSIMLILMIYAGFAQFFLDSIYGSISENNFVLGGIIIFTLTFITFVSSFIVSLYVVSDIKRSIVLIGSVFSYIFTLLIVFGICLLCVTLMYPDFVNSLQLEGIEYLTVLFPLCILYFSVYVVNNFIFLDFIIILFYYVIFIILLGDLDYNVRDDKY